MRECERKQVFERAKAWDALLPACVTSMDDFWRQLRERAEVVDCKPFWAFTTDTEARGKGR